MQFKTKRPETANIPHSITMEVEVEYFKAKPINQTSKSPKLPHTKATQAESGQWDT